MRAEGTVELLRRKIERETQWSSPDSTWCETCEMFVIHQPIPDDRFHCECSWITVRGAEVECSCQCHNPSTFPGMAE